MPLRHYIFNSLTVVSLLLMLATVGLWVVSFNHRPYLNYVSRGPLHEYSLDFRLSSGVLDGNWHSLRYNESDGRQYDWDLNIYILNFAPGRTRKRGPGKGSRNECH